MLISLPTLHPPSVPSFPPPNPQERETTQLTTPQPHTLWYPALHSSSTSSPSSLSPPSPPHHNHNHNHNHHHHNHHRNPNNPAHRPTPLSTTTIHADELTIQHRKTHIRRYGAHWLRPIGVGKTLQGLEDERAEREEGELVRAREMAAAMEAARAEAEAEMGVEDEEGGRDLDGDVPDADGDGWSDADDDDLDLDAAAEEEEDMDAELEGAEQTLLRDGTTALDPDLDDEIPEAEDGDGEGGSYEHTDTEVEDESSEDGGGAGAGFGGGSGRQAGLTVVGNGGDVFGGDGVVRAVVLGAMRRSAGGVGRGRGRGMGMGREN